MTVHRPQAKAEDGTLSRTKFRFLDDSHIPTTPRSFDPRRVGIWEKGETMRKQMSHEGQRARQRGPGCVLGGGGGARPSSVVGEKEEYRWGLWLKKEKGC